MLFGSKNHVLGVGRSKARIGRGRVGVGVGPGSGGGSKMPKIGPKGAKIGSGEGSFAQKSQCFGSKMAKMRFKTSQKRSSGVQNGPKTQKDRNFGPKVSKNGKNVKSYPNLFCEQ